MSTAADVGLSQVPRADALPRLLSGLGPDGDAVGLGQHLARWGPLDLRWTSARLLDEVDASGLVGHGGAWFPVATKWRDVGNQGRRRPVVVANGAEGEPASGKDALLLTRTPHLVLDGLSAAAAVLGAHRAVVYVPARLVRTVQAAVIERQRWGMDPVDVEVVPSPDAFVAGQESAVVNALSGQIGGVPSFVGLQSIRERGVGGRPTLVQNAETLANVALIARFGASWFRALGTDRLPGTMLLTVSGRWEGTAIVEAPLGAFLRDVLQLSPTEAHRYRGALLGGYGGGWITMPTLLNLVLSEKAARQANTSLGAGVVALLPGSVCPLAEMARVVRYMAQQGAGQCGPCVNGLAALADEAEGLAFGPPAQRRGVESILELCSLVEGRGACRHPDGVARFVRSACTVFTDEVGAHRRHGPCALTREPGYLPIPRPVPRRSQEVHR